VEAGGRVEDGARGPAGDGGLECALGDTVGDDPGELGDEGLDMALTTSRASAVSSM
jgi:hypothetical protein